MDMQDRKRQFRRISFVLFIIYIALICYLVFFSAEFGRAELTEGYSRVNLLPFKEIRRFILCWNKVGIFSAFLNTFGNVIGFMPLGFLCPVIFKRMRRLAVILFTGFLLSLLIETLQLLFQVGVFDIDDLILNSLGTMIGYAVYKAAERIDAGKYR